MKKEIREELRRKLKGQSESDRAVRSRRIHRRLFHLEPFRKARCLLIYLSLPEEVDTLAVIERCLSMGKRVVVPKVDGARKTLDLREIRDVSRDLERGSHGIPAPRTARTRKVSPEEIDFAVLPGLGFDSGKNRLGRGGGYFDRLLAALPRSAPRVALCYEFQVVDRIPVESHDLPVDIVLSS